MEMPDVFDTIKRAQNFQREVDQILGKPVDSAKALNQAIKLFELGIRMVDGEEYIFSNATRTFAGKVADYPDLAQAIKPKP